jgi:catechol 2,3-dioxygenase-like lactoylglutathione lyase family enzyme
MNTTDTTLPAAPPQTATVDLKLEAVIVPVSDVDRAKAFYVDTLGWREDADFATGANFRIVQVTPPNSPASVHFGTGVAAGVPGSIEALTLAVEDIKTARADLVGRGVEVSEIFHHEGGVFHHAGTTARISGPHPERASYGSWATFTDPDGNTFWLQEITTRLGGRTSSDVATIAELLRETSEHHDRFEKAATTHNWWDWYAAYFHARQHGSTPDQADAAADLYMNDTLGVETAGHPTTAACRHPAAGRRRHVGVGASRHGQTRQRLIKR